MCNNGQRKVVRTQKKNLHKAYFFLEMFSLPIQSRTIILFNYLNEATFYYYMHGFLKRYINGNYIFRMLLLSFP